MLTDEPIEKRSLGKPRRGWENNIIMKLKKWGEYKEFGYSAPESPCECSIKPPVP